MERRCFQVNLLCINDKSAFNQWVNVNRFMHERREPYKSILLAKCFCVAVIFSINERFCCELKFNIFDWDLLYCGTAASSLSFYRYCDEHLFRNSNTIILAVVYCYFNDKQCVVNLFTNHFFHLFYGNLIVCARRTLVLWKIYYCDFEVCVGSRKINCESV